MIGPRGFGKTSILTSAASIARERGAIVIQVNAEEYASLAALATHIIKQAGEQLRSKTAAGARLIESVFAALHPRITFDLLTNAWSVSVTAESGPEETTYFKHALESLNALANRVERPVAFIIDVLQQVVSEEGISAERQLRAVIQRH